MKPTTLLLTASLVVNAALFALFLSRSSSPSTPSAPSRLAAPARPSPSASADALLAALASGDAAALQAAGLSPETARELVAGRALLRAAERVRALRAAKPADDRWWRTNRATVPAQRELDLQVRRELTDALAAAGLSDLSPFSPTGTGNPDLFSFLPAEKQDALRRISQDYDEMMAKFSTGGVQLPSDRERLKLLREERDRDIAALLSPAEFADYQMRTSSTAQNLRIRYGDAIETEADFKKLYALQKAFDEKYAFDPAAGRPSPDTLRQRAEASRQLQEEMRAALGDDKFAALRRASDHDLRTIDSLASRLNLPPQTTDRVISARDTYAAESQRINANTTLTPQDRRAQLQALGNRAKTELTQTLGAEAAEAYAQRSPWVSMLQNGIAYTTTPPADVPGLALGLGSSVHPVPPAGASGPGANRQTFTIAAPDVITTDGAAVIAPAAGVRVMSFSTSETTTDTPPATGQRVLVTPPDPTTPPAPKR